MRLLSTFLPFVIAPVSAVTLSFGSLPSAQGWNFVNDGVTEVDNIGLAAGVLSINTIGAGASFGYYEYSPPLSTGISYLVFEARLLQNEGSDFPEFGFGFGVYDSNVAYVVGLGQGYVKAYQGTSAAFDTSVFRTYVLAVNHDLQSYVLSVDGTPLLNGTPVVSGGNMVAFGDLTSGGNAHGELRFLTYDATAGLPNAGIPEPATALLAMSGCLLVAALRRVR